MRCSVAETHYREAMEEREPSLYEIMVSGDNGLTVLSAARFAVRRCRDGAVSFGNYTVYVPRYEM